MKQCNCCKKYKPLIEFFKNYRNPEGLQYACKDCDKDRRRKLYNKYRDRETRSARQRRANLKLKVLTYYSIERKLQCSWPGCQIFDIDMLTLDHIDNDGAKHRAELGFPERCGGGMFLYNFIIKNNFPKGFQTLCANHQLKKEILRKRAGCESYNQISK